MRESPVSVRELVLLVSGCFVLAVWAIAVLVQVALPTHVVPGQVHGIALVVAIGLFGGAAVTARRNGKNGDT